jgi:3-deoxy-manno-octulosonate cytidylyltransferase (CMP-KDO synthetase)
MKTLVVIPVRYASVRFPGKPLAQLVSSSGVSRSLAHWTWLAAKPLSRRARIVLATDDDRIEAECRSFGGEVVRTSTNCRNGTERCAEAYRALGEEFDLVVNLQGDAPLTPPWILDALIDAFSDTTIDVATPALPTSGRMLSALREDRREGRVGATTLVQDRNGNALYFSKEVLPYTAAPFADEEMTPVYHHIGAYAYRPAALAAYLELRESMLERTEGLEQLRFLENGIPIRCVPAELRGRSFWEVNNPEDIPKVEPHLGEIVAE